MVVFLSTKDVAEKLGITPQRAYDLLVKENRIPYVKFGRSIKVPVTAWDEFLVSQHEAAMESLGNNKLPRDAHLPVGCEVTA